jgi:hypothetical protein
VAIDLCGPQSGQDTLLVLRRRHSIDRRRAWPQLRAQGLQVEWCRAGRTGPPSAR